MKKLSFGRQMLDDLSFGHLCIVHSTFQAGRICDVNDEYYHQGSSLGGDLRRVCSADSESMSSAGYLRRLLRRLMLTV